LKVSIITINYNNAYGLKSTIDSVLSQSYSNIEYIVVDGGSTDNSKEVIKNNANRLYYWVSEKDSGVYEAMNKGITVSNGEYLLFLNSGDIFVDSEVVSKAVNNPDFNADLVYGNLLVVNEKQKREWIAPDKLNFSLFFESTIPHPATFIKKSLFDQVGYFDQDLKIVSDWKFFLMAVCRYNCTYRHIDLLISIFKEDGICSKPENFVNIELERQKVLSSNFSSFINDTKELLSSRKQLRKLRYTIKIKKLLGIR